MDSAIEPGLFDPPEGWIPPEDRTPEPVSRGEKRQRLVERRIRDGIHPLGYVSLHPHAARERDGEGLRCGTCQFRELQEHHNRTYPKCLYGNGKRVSGCESSDIRAWWPACRDYQTRQEPTHA